MKEQGYEKEDEYPMWMSGHLPFSMNIFSLIDITPHSPYPHTYPARPTRTHPLLLLKEFPVSGHPLIFPLKTENTHPKKIIPSLAAQGGKFNLNETLRKRFSFIFLFEDYHFISECQCSFLRRIVVCFVG